MAATDAMTQDARSEPPQPRPPIPSWLGNSANLAWRVLAIAALIAVAWLLVSVFWIVAASIAVGVVVSAVFAPMVLRLREGGRSRNSAALLVWTASLGAISLLVLILGLAFVPYIVEILDRADQALTTLQASLASLSIPPVVGNVLHDALHAVREVAVSHLGGVVASAASAATIILLAIFLVFFLLRDGDRGWLWFFQTLGDEKRDAITDAGRDALARVGGYLRGTTVLAGLIAITDYVFMVVLGVPLALPLAVLVFMAGFIPYIGGIVASAVILLVAYLAQGTGAVLVLLVLMGIRNVVVGYGVRPTLYGRAVSIHPAVVLIALPAGWELAGVIGLFAAVPITAVILSVARAAITILQPDGEQELPTLVPGWLDRVAQFSWRVVALVAVGALAVFMVVALPIVVIPIVGGLILAATLDPLVIPLVKRGWSRTRASIVAVGGSIIAISVMLIFAAISLIDGAPETADTVKKGGDAANNATGGLLGLPNDLLHGGLITGLEAVKTTIENFATLGVVGVLSALLAFYFLRDGGAAWMKVTGRSTPQVASELRGAGTRAFEALGGYMLGTAAISFVGAASQALIMVLLGLPHVLPVFVLSFFLCFIPYIGGYISTGIAFFITLAVGSPLAIIIMFTWTMVFNIVQGNVIAPIVYGKTVHIHPAIVLLAIPAGGAVAGIMGMFIAVPAVGVVAASWRSVLTVLGDRARAIDAIRANAMEANAPPGADGAEGPLPSATPLPDVGTSTA